MNVSPFSSSQLNHAEEKSSLALFHQRFVRTFDKLPEKGKFFEILERIGIVCIAILAYPVLGLVVGFQRLFGKTNQIKPETTKKTTLPTTTPPILSDGASDVAKFKELQHPILSAKVVVKVGDTLYYS